MRTSVIVAGTLAIGATAWILSGQFGATDKRAAANGSQNTETQAKKPLGATAFTPSSTLAIKRDWKDAALSTALCRWTSCM